MTALVLQANASRLPLPDESVDLIVTSPPYFALRSYRDGGEHYAGQLGAEPTPQEFLEALWAVARECWRVLKPSGSMFWNMGDKRSGSGGNNQSGLGDPRLQAATEAATGFRGGPRRYNQEAFGRAKSKMLLPHRFAIGCEDGLADPDGIGWIVRQDIVWEKPNGLPESVQDRTRDNHEVWFHLTKQGRYYSALDEIRAPHAPGSVERIAAGSTANGRDEAPVPHNGVAAQTVADGGRLYDPNPLGVIPGSVWRIPTEPLTVPAHVGVDHFAAFPSEWPRRLILGWSPPGVCVECGEGRRPVVEVEHEKYRDAPTTGRPHKQDLKTVGGGFNKPGYTQTRTSATIVGYACACTPRTPPTRPSVILDIFGGTGTTAMVARALGRHGISIDLSADYCRLARWRIFESGGGAKAVGRTNQERQGTLAL